MAHKIGIIGYGNMGSAIAERIKKSYKVAVFEKDLAKTARVSGIEAEKELSVLVGESDALILAVKPQDFPQTFLEIENCGYELDKLVISIAAGITTSYIEEHFGMVRVIRVMPNMPAKIGAGMTCLSKGKFASEVDLKLAIRIFRRLGKVLLLDESMMDAATAISGNGPGYVYYLLDKGEFIKAEFLKELIEQAVNLGFGRREAVLMARTTISGALKALKTSGLSVHELKTQVISRGGMTEAALKVKDSGASWEQAIKAAVARGEELAKK